MLLSQSQLIVQVVGVGDGTGVDGRLLVLLPPLGDVVGERVVGVGGAEKGLDAQEDSSDLEGGRPVS